MNESQAVGTAIPRIRLVHSIVGFFVVVPASFMPVFAVFAFMGGDVSVPLSFWGDAMKVFSLILSTLFGLVIWWVVSLVPTPVGWLGSLTVVPTMLAAFLYWSVRRATERAGLWRARYAIRLVASASLAAILSAGAHLAVSAIFSQSLPTPPLSVRGGGLSIDVLFTTFTITGLIAGVVIEVWWQRKLRLYVDTAQPGTIADWPGTAR